MQLKASILALFALTPLLALASPIQACANEIQVFQPDVSPADAYVEPVSINPRRTVLRCMIQQCNAYTHVRAVFISFQLVTAYLSLAIFSPSVVNNSATSLDVSQKWCVSLCYRRCRRFIYVLCVNHDNRREAVVEESISRRGGCKPSDFSQRTSTAKPVRSMRPKFQYVGSSSDVVLANHER